MKRERQRQGRDFPPFSIHEYLKNAGNETGVKHIVPDEVADTGILEDKECKKSVLDTLERLKAEAEENVTPVDGHEPGHSVPER